MGKSDIYEPEGTTLHVESPSPSVEDAVLRVPSPCSSGTPLQSARHGHGDTAFFRESCHKKPCFLMVTISR